jgi:LPXTG-motif cell wall-anchored protein
MRVSQKMKLLVVIVFLFSLFASGFQARVAAADEADTPEIVTAKVTVVRADTNETVQEETEVHLSKNATGLDALVAAVGEAEVQTEESQYGKFITGIKGAQAHDSYYWAFYINGISSSVGADSYLVRDGEELTFSLEEWNQNNAVTIKVIGKDGKVIAESPYPYSIYGQPTAFQLLQALVGPEKVGYTIDPIYGAFIESINGLAADENHFWSFLVNGNWAMDSVGDYVLQYGDEITFKYASIEEPAETPDDENGVPEEEGANQSPTPAIDPKLLQSTIDAAIARIPADEIGDWEIIAFKKAGKTVPADYLEKVTNIIKDANGTFRKITDYERYTLGILAAGGDPTNVEGYNLVASIYNGDVTKQGANGVAFALIALDSADFAVPSDAKWTREKLVNELVNTQQPDGRWTGLSSDVDLTAMALTALAPYKDHAEVAVAIDNALTYLSNEYKGGKIDTSNAVAQVIIALSALGIDPNGELFTKDGESIVHYLLSFKNEDGGFGWKAGTPSETGPTSQAVQALAAYQLYLNGEGSLYDFSLAEQKPVAQQPETQPQLKEGASGVQQQQTVAAESQGLEKSNTGNKLPNTATNTYNLLSFGLLILLAGAGIFIFEKRKRA